MATSTTQEKADGRVIIVTGYQAVLTVCAYFLATNLFAEVWFPVRSYGLPDPMVGFAAAIMTAAVAGSLRKMMLGSDGLVGASLALAAMIAFAVVSPIFASTVMLVFAVGLLVVLAYVNSEFA
jgi:hypothetical protein